MSERDWKLVKSETLVLGSKEMRALAAKHSALPQSPTERLTNPGRIEKLQKAIEEGHAIPFNWAVVLYGGKTLRMNGHHSSIALATHKMKLPDGLTVHLDHYEAGGREAMAELFRQFDARWSARSKADIAGAFQGLDEAVANLPRDPARLAIDGIAWHNRNVEGVPTESGDDVYANFFKGAYHSFIQFYSGLEARMDLRRAAVVAAMWASFFTGGSPAEDFWRGVVENNYTDDEEPGALLTKDLETIREGLTKPPPGVYYRKCIKAWNAHREGKKIRSLNIPANGNRGWPDVAA